MRLNRSFLDTARLTGNPDQLPAPPHVASPTHGRSLSSMRTARLCLLLALLPIGNAFGADPQDRPSDTGVTAETLAVIVNDNDPQSREVARYYQARPANPDCQHDSRALCTG
jgi:hypothetical protein